MASHLLAGCRSHFWVSSSANELNVVVLAYTNASYNSAACCRAVLPESPAFVASRAGGESGKQTKTFIKEAGRAVKTHWWRCVYGILIMTGFNFFSHGSQDLYPVYLENAKGISNKQASRATIIANVGAICGGIMFVLNTLLVMVRSTWLICN